MTEIEVLSHSPSRAIFVATMLAVTNPLTGGPLASLDAETGALVPSPGLRIDEVGTIWKVEPEFDTEGNMVAPGVAVPGHHVNFVAVGALAKILTDGMPTEGDIFVRTRILSMLGKMDWKPITVEGVPEGYEGTSGMRLFDPDVVDNRARKWARPAA